MIRQYEPGDRDEVVEVWDQASAVAHPFLSPEFMAAEKEQVRNVHLEVADVWVATKDDAIVGFIALVGHEVGAIFVRPSAHGSGHGLALMAHAQKILGDLEVEVFEKNAIGRAFYAKCGFEVIDTKVHGPTEEPMFRLRLVANKWGCRSVADA